MTVRPAADRRRGGVDRVTASVLSVAAAVAGGITFLIVAYLLLGSAPALRSVGALRFLTDPTWSPTAELYSLGPMIVGTGVVTAGAVLLATPLAVASAVFGRFYVRGALARAHRRILETLAGIPSVVYGLWGLMVLAPAIAHLGPPGQSALAGIAVLALMILPTVALVGDAALGAVAQEQLRAAAASGLSRWAVVRSIVLPAARPGIAVGVLLGTGRALGETMAVLMVTGNVVQVPDSLLAPVRTLTANIALEMAYATDAHLSALFVSGLALAGVTIGLVLAVDRIGARPGTNGAHEHVV